MSAGTPRTLSSAAAALRAGETSSVELVTEAIAVADAHDEAVGTFITRFVESSLEAAAAADAALATGDPVGPLHGLPIGIKDIITTREGVSTAQSLVLDPAWGDGDAVVVQRLRSAGAVVTGKLTTMEFASGLPDASKPFPIARNPWDLDRWAGGSSSGSGSGVAAGMFLGALGTDTGGSIRIPASFCGITGLMPTFGRVPKSGCVPLGFTLDHIGPMARSARDCALMLSVMAGHDSSDPTTIDMPVDDYLGGLTGDLRGVRIGVDRVSGTDGITPDPALAAAIEEGIEALESRGAIVSEIRLPAYAETVAAVMALCAGEVLAYHRQDLRTQLEDYVASNRLMYAGLVGTSAADYVQAQRVRRVAHRALMALYEEVDLVLTPTAFVGAPALADLHPDTPWIRTVNTPYWDVMGNPVISVPAGFTADGLPLGLQLAGRPFDEALVLRAADAFQQVTAWHLSTPSAALAVG